MLKRVLFAGGVLLGAAYLGCGGDSGNNGGTLSQTPYLQTDRDSIVDTLCKGTHRPQTLLVTNRGEQDLVFGSPSLSLSSSDSSLITPVPLPDGGVYAPFRLLANGVLSSDPNVTTPTVVTTLKSLHSGFVNVEFTSPDAGFWQASLAITSNAGNVNGGTKVIPLGIIGPDAGTQNCP